MKILNLYAGIGGNRKLWGDEHEITAVEIVPEIAAIYKDFFPDDTVLIEDAHEYLLKHYKEYDFIWSSPPCPTHSITNFFLNAKNIIRYPDMKLWQEILLLQNLYDGKFCIENVKSYYEPLIKPQEVGRHYLWSNFKISTIELPKVSIGRMNGKNQTASKKSLVERNQVDSKLGLHILNCSMNIITSENVKQLQLL